MGVGKRLKKEVGRGEEGGRGGKASEIEISKGREGGRDDSNGRHLPLCSVMFREIIHY